MRLLHQILHPVANHSRLALVAGLILGIFIPPLADLIKPWVGYWVAVLLFLAAFRIQPRDALGSREDYKYVAIFIAVFQILIPCFVALFFLGINFNGPLAIALLILFTSAPISGSPGLTMITGNNPVPTLRLLVFTMALLPLTIFLPFSIMPFLGNPQEVSWIALKLFLIIFSASILAFALRHLFLRNPSKDTIKSIDALTAIAMAIVVIGLMTGFDDAMFNRPLEILLMLIIAFIVNIGIQVLVWFAVDNFNFGDTRAAFAICAGNRNLAIFLAALPATITDPILLFIACYQIPMYLTPTLLGRIYGNQK